MLSKYATKWGTCGGAIAAGELIHYVKTAPRGRRVHHPACWSQRQAPAAQPQPVKPSAPSKPAPGATVLRRRFGSIAEVLACLPPQWPADLWNGNQARGAYERRTIPADQQSGTRATWYDVPLGAIPIEVARDLATKGAPEHVARMRAGIGALAADLPPPVDIRRRRRWTDQGDELDMSRVYIGRLDAAWQRCQRQQSRAPRTVTIAAAMGIPSECAADQLFWRGAACVTLADLLTEAGYSVEIIGFVAGTLCDDKWTPQDMHVIIKDARAPLDINAVAAALSPTFIRGAWYAVEAIESARLGVGTGPGISYSHEHATGRENPFATGVLPAGAIMVPTECDTADKARAWIIEAIQTINAPMELAA